MKVQAPGKLILSGEHAVVYGHPAIAMAIDRYVTAKVSRQSLPQILLDLSDITHCGSLSFHALQLLKNKIKRKYQRFIQGDFNIREVLQKPFELAQFALGIFVESLNLSFPEGVKIHLSSTIPMGCGMGSSAATILCVLEAASRYWRVPLSQETLFQLALQAENMQHGRSSGLDLHVGLQGGCVYMNQNNVESRPLPTFPLYMINTGTPVNTTGECVERVANYFQSSHLGDEFAAVTQLMDQALQQSSFQAMRDAIRYNHQLLVQIKVVPEKVQRLITDIEAHEGAAKICGAGAIQGDQAGALIILSHDQQVVKSLSARYGYEVQSVVAESRGVHAA